MRKARRLKHLFGGAMRQAGSCLRRRGCTPSTTTSSGSPTITPTPRVFADDLVAGGVPVVNPVWTNIVLIDVGALGLGADDAVARMRAVGLSSYIPQERSPRRDATSTSPRRTSDARSS